MTFYNGCKSDFHIRLINGANNPKTMLTPKINIKQALVQDIQRQLELSLPSEAPAPRMSDTKIKPTGFIKRMNSVNGEMPCSRSAYAAWIFGMATNAIIVNTATITIASVKGVICTGFLSFILC